MCINQPLIRLHNSSLLLLQHDQNSNVERICILRHDLQMENGHSHGRTTTNFYPWPVSHPYQSIIVIVCHCASPKQQPRHHHFSMCRSWQYSCSKPHGHMLQPRPHPRPRTWQISVCPTTWVSLAKWSGAQGEAFVAFVAFVVPSCHHVPSLPSSHDSRPKAGASWPRCQNVMAQWPKRGNSLSKRSGDVHFGPKHTVQVQVLKGSTTGQY